ncbi:MAG: hypothetical protein K2J42_01140 [Muribaculaceae bacterium]|nr:hypothetical protein [Muribaculaceae bacterium]
MKKEYRHLWLILALAFALFFVMSMFDIPSVFGYKPKSSGMADLLLKNNFKTIVADSDTVGCDSIAPPAPKFPVPVDTATQTILFIGDSMLDGLSPRLAAYAKESGHHQYSVIWYSSTSEKWSNSKRLKEYIDTIHPSFIFICLGSNELMVKDIIEKRGDFVRDIVSQAGDIPFLWIGPPNWREDTGINRLIEMSVPEGAYFKSDGMKFERRKDGAHPTAASAALWMDSIVRWMPNHAIHPIRLEMPEKKTARPDRIFIHQPSEN